MMSYAVSLSMKGTFMARKRLMTRPRHAVYVCPRLAALTILLPTLSSPSSSTSGSCHDSDLDAVVEALGLQTLACAMCLEAELFRLVA